MDPQSTESNKSQQNNEYLNQTEQNKTTINNASKQKRHRKILIILISILIIIVAVFSVVIFQVKNSLKYNNPQFRCGGLSGAKCPSGYFCQEGQALRNIPNSGLCLKEDAQTLNSTKSPSPTPIPTANPDSIGTNWKTYIYKNMSFQYPNDWIVIFDSEITGQPNGFSLHIQWQNETGYQPDGLYLTTNNLEASKYTLSPTKEFTLTDKGDNYISFDINGTPIYASCAFYSEKKATLNICNKILSTFKFTQ